ncbi:hypothetical protein C5167_015367 [Papaver somniferum]|uniref:RING-type domain-containing protein n=1 Tax=Papaver somniferum TaxID=3469 RepID=A0A4Y7J6R6_PAPSO|nr:uncharacterized protein At4g10930-like isoform X1 [Papaver somniferum]XP_026457794.1 uncharacterized protein At4g10930-like isoform X1 [Papaver somniferum]RZC56517.1 hypothetical protein C5167_015367 [Papaver somniferum]
MDAELDTSGLLEVEDSSFAIMGDMDTTSFENEKCGICMDVVIDRGAIDSCQHWFCFSCIDNWSTITSLCPLCQKEFQLITCVPVFDTIGSGRADDEFLSGDEEWSIQGSNNTLSFPSYYIDENAVICLDGDGCKIRSGSAKIEDDPNLDTSIACDSCDLWYHAFCVGFDTEATSENSWLCPRCVVNEVAHKFDGASEIDHECSGETALSKPLHVSVADAGETAVVVSSVEKKQCEVPNDNIASAFDTKEDRIKEHSLSYATFSSTTLEMESVYNIQPNSNLPEALSALSFSLDTPGKLKSNGVQVKVAPVISDGDKTSVDMTSNGSEPTINVPSFNLYFGLSSQSSLSVDKNDFNATESHMEDLMQQMPLEESSLPAKKLGPDAKEAAVGFNALKRKVMSHSSGHIDVNEDSEIGIRENSVKGDTGVSAMSARADRKFPKAACNSGVRDYLKRGPQKHPKLPAASESDKVNDVTYKKRAVPDIMTIVRGTLSKPTVRLSDGRDNGAGLRVKKIMRRNVEDASSKLLEELRNQIREAVRNKDTKDLNKYAFDPKLLKAFRAAVGGKKAESEPSKKLDPSIARAKKSMLQKGKTRESLTKKIYGNVNGRRKRAWDREWEVEFWKHRATNISRPEKMETLKSVLDLLRKSSESSDVDSEPEDDAKSSILSRLYLADTSVFPRKDDIKPLSVLAEIDNNETNLEYKISSLTDNDRVGQSLIHNSKNTSAVSGPSVGDKRKINVSPRLKVETASRKPMAHDSKMKAQSMKESPGKSDPKIDKRKWALEVLARKTAVTERDSNQRKQEDNSALKGNYPLLAQLPADMKPVLAESRHNKVPISVRQAQLYRMTEYFLKLADLPVIRRTAITELAVADAVNIEKDVVDRSSSKLVYVNLCSQALRQHVHSSKLVGPEEPNPSSSSPPHPESVEPSPGDSTDPSIEEALKMAGLVSNSPGDSPYRVTEKEPDSVFDMDSHPDLDIYGDFEYDLGDEDLIGASALNVSMSQTEEVDMKMKVVFSTLNTEKIDHSLNSKDQKMTVTDEKPPDSKEKNMENSMLELATNTSCPSLEQLQGELDGELSLAEYEELYGPDKEPLVEKFPKIESVEQNKSIIGCGDIVNHTISKGSEHQGESSAEKMVEGSFPAEVGFSEGNHSPNHSLMSKSVRPKDKKPQSGKQTEISHSVSKKVEAYIKEHIRPLCKSGVITAEQYRWAVTKTTEKVMRYHMKDKNANFLIKEGEKVKKLAEEYVEAAQEKGENPL